MYPGKYAIQHPDKPAFIMAESGEVVTYREYEARCNRLAHLLREPSLKQKDHYAIFTDGIYGRSRNPIYLSMLIGFAGIAIGAGSLASFPLLVVFWAILQFYVIAREERYLEAKFGQQYSDYRNTVRRWL